MAGPIRIAILANATKAKIAFKEVTRGADSMAQRLGKAGKEVNGLATTAAALGPAIIPAVAGAGVAVLALGNAFAGAGAATGVFQAVMKSTLTGVQETAGKVTDLRTAAADYGKVAKAAQARGDIDAANEALDKQKDALRQVKETLAGLPPAQRGAVEGYLGMQGAWQKFVDANNPTTYALITRGTDLLRKSIPQLQPLFDVAAAAATKFLGVLERWQAGGGLKSLVAFLAGQAQTAFTGFGAILVNLGTGFKNLFRDTAGQSAGILQFLTDLSAKFATFSAGNGFSTFVNNTATQGPQLVAVLGNIAQTLGTLVQAVAPFAPISLAVAQGLTSIINAVPPGVITAVVAAFILYNGALKLMAGYALAATTATLAQTAATKAGTAFTKAAAAAQWLLNAALTANPIGLVIVAVVALGAALVLAYQKSETFRNIVNGAFTAVKNAATTAWNAIKSGAQNAWNFAKSTVNNFKSVASATITAFRNTVGRVWSAIRSAASSAWSAIKSLVNTAVNLIKGYANAYRTVAVGVFRAVRSAASNAWSGIRSLVSAAVNAIKSAINGFKTAASNAFRAVRTAASNAFSAIRSAVSNAISNFRSQFDRIKGIAQNALSAMKNVFSPSALYNAGVQLISGLVRGITNKMGDAVGAVKSGLDKIKNLLPGSPIKDGPLKPWNNGGAGRKLMSMLAYGIRAGGSEVEGAMSRALGPVSSPALGYDALSAGSAGLAGVPLQINFNGLVTDPVAAGREVENVINKYRRLNARPAI